MNPAAELIAAVQAVPWHVGFGVALAAYPAWRATTRLVEALGRRWEDGPAMYAAALALTTVGFAPIGLTMLFAIGLGADAVSAASKRFDRCIVERFMPDGTSAGKMFMDGPCPVSAQRGTP